LAEVFGPGQWSLVPDGKPMLQDGFVCWQFHLFVQGRWVATAIGEHPDPRWQKMSLANRAEAAKSDALVKCSKALGVFADLWRSSWRRQWMAEYAVRVYAKQTERSQWAWLWRRKDNTGAFFEEGRPGRGSESEYQRKRGYDDDAREHVAAIAKEG